MLTVQPLGLDGAKEELRAVGVSASVGHRQDSGTGMLQSEILVLKTLTVDRHTTSAIALSEIAALTHEVRDDTMESRSLVSFASLTSAKRSEVLGGLGNDVRAKLQIEEGARIAKKTN